MYWNLVVRQNFIRLHILSSYRTDLPAITGYLFSFFCMYGDLFTILSVTSVRSPVPS